MDATDMFRARLAAIEAAGPPPVERRKNPPPTDEFAPVPFATGLHCTFFGVNVHADAICPTCSQNLQVTDEAGFWKRLQDFEDGTYSSEHFGADATSDPDWKPHPHPGYVAMWKWQAEVNRCFRHAVHLRNSYRKHVGIDVDMNI